MRMIQTLSVFQYVSTYLSNNFPSDEAEDVNFDNSQDMYELLNPWSENHAHYPSDTPFDMDIDELDEPITESPLLTYSDQHSSYDSADNSLHVIKFGQRAGKPIEGFQAKSADDTYVDWMRAFDPESSSSSNNIYAPFKSKMDWEIAKWAKLRGPGSTAFSDLLAINGVSNLLFITQN
jgi:hypothetical protein